MHLDHELIEVPEQVELHVELSWLQHGDRPLQNDEEAIALRPVLTHILTLTEHLVHDNLVQLHTVVIAELSLLLPASGSLAHKVAGALVPHEYLHVRLHELVYLFVFLLGALRGRPKKDRGDRLGRVARGL